MRKRYQATWFKGSDAYVNGALFDNKAAAEEYCELREAWILRNDLGGFWGVMEVDCIEEGDPLPPIPPDKVKTISLSRETKESVTNLYLILREAIRKNRNELFKGASASRMYDCIVQDVEQEWSDFQKRHGL